MKKLIAETKLERAALAMVKRYSDGNQADWISDLLRYGCQSGMVPGLIYYSDTTKFFRKHRNDITQIIAEYKQDGCLDLDDLRGWDSEDPLARGDNNQNVLAWFGFEEAVRAMAYRAGYDY